MKFSESDFNPNSFIIQDKICYLTLTASNEFSIEMFGIPKGLSMPMHDHPAMLVFTYIMYGSVKML